MGLLRDHLMDGTINPSFINDTNKNKCCSRPNNKISTSLCLKSAKLSFSLPLYIFTYLSIYPSICLSLTLYLSLPPSLSLSLSLSLLEEEEEWVSKVWLLLFRGHIKSILKEMSFQQPAAVYSLTNKILFLSHFIC